MVVIADITDGDDAVEAITQRAVRPASCVAT